MSRLAIRFTIITLAIAGALLLRPAETLQAQSVPTSLVTLQNAATVAGDGVAMNLAGAGALAIQVKGTFTGTVTFQASVDGGANWAVVQAVNLSTGTAATTATAVGVFQMSVAGLSQFKASFAPGTGAVTVVARRSANTPGLH